MKERKKEKKKMQLAPPPVSVPPCGPNFLTPSHTFYCHFYFYFSTTIHFIPTPLPNWSLITFGTIQYPLTAIF